MKTKTLQNPFTKDPEAELARRLKNAKYLPEKNLPKGQTKSARIPRIRVTEFPRRKTSGL